jgi:DNA adenine methylase
MVTKLLKLVPPGGKPYVEPYCGAASLFFARDPAPVEVLNDLDGEIVNLFRCLQDKRTFEELRHRLTWTLYARAEFARALEVGETADKVERAWATFVKHNMGISGIAETVGRWSRTFVSARGMAMTTSKWLMRLSLLDAWRLRLMRAQIDNRDALEVIRYWDSPDTVFYLDPPYHLDTRKGGRGYKVDQDGSHHEMLVETVLNCKGAVVLSGYEHEVYDALTKAGWEQIGFKTVCFAASRNRNSGLQGVGAASAKVPRVEVVWRNQRAVELSRHGRPLL